MNLEIVGKQFELTDSIKSYIENVVDTLNKYNLDIISVRSIISADEKKGKKGFDVDFAINLPRQSTIVIKQKDKDLYAALDLAIDRANKVLRRIHDKMVTHKDADIKKEEAILPDVEDDIIVDEIVPTELELYKPLEIEEALEKLKNSTAQFLVFNDIEAKMRVLYKRNDGKFGLY